MNKKPQSFLSKLYDILSDINYNSIIHWDAAGKKIIITNPNDLCQKILPKFYKHHNFSSFVRQLNMYGFHKSKGIISEGESYEHEKFTKKSTKEEISNNIKPIKKKKLVVDYIKSNQKEDLTNDTDFLLNGNEEEIFKYLFEKNEEITQNSLALKAEVEKLKKENSLLNDELNILKSTINFHRLLLEKILSKQKGQNLCKNENNINSINLNQMFNKYLYSLRIYSPFVDFDYDKVIKKKLQSDQCLNKEDEIKNDERNLMDIMTSNAQNEIEEEDNHNKGESLFNLSNDFPLLDLNLCNNMSSKTFSQFFV
jgi:hypothetical protein